MQNQSLCAVVCTLANCRIFLWLVLLVDMLRCACERACVVCVFTLLLRPRHRKLEGRIRGMFHPSLYLVLIRGTKRNEAAHWDSDFL